MLFRSAKLDEWLQKSYYRHYVNETLVGQHSVITIITFINGRNDDFIKELSNYLEGNKDYISGHYLIEYKLFKD